MDNDDNFYTVNQGIEQYIMSVSKDDYMNIYKLSTRQRSQSIFVCALIFVVSALIFIPFNSRSSLVLLLTGSFYILLMLIGSHSIKKNWAKKSLLIENKQFLVDVFDERLSLSIIENNELVSKASINYDSIITINENNEFFVFSDDMQVYFIRKSIIAHDSILFDKFKNAAEKYAKNKKFNASTTFLLVLTFVLYAFVGICKDSIALYLGNPCCLLYLAVLPFSVGMIINSLIRKKRDLKWIPTLIAGIFVSFLCVISSLEQIGYNKYYNSGYNIIAETEKHIGIEIPVPEYIDFYKYSYTENNNIEIINEVCMEFGDQEYVQTDINYVEKIISNDVWMKGLPDEYLDIIPDPDYFSESEYSILYNVDTKEINTVPTESGTHRLVIIAYYYGILDIVEYSITL